MSSRQDRRLRWRQSVYASRPGMTDGCRVLLLRMLDEMDAKGVVSIPRSRLAAALGIAPARVSERIKLARSLGLLDVVRRARPQVTAVYQAVIPPTPEGYNTRTSEVRHTVSVTGTESVPTAERAEVRMYPTQEVVGPEVVRQPAVAPLGEERSNDKSDTCSVCGWSLGSAAHRIRCREAS
jgi:hypothetical protein